MAEAFRLKAIEANMSVEFEFAGKPILGREGESIAAALLAAGISASRCTAKNSEPRGYFCGMGICWECVVEIEGVGSVRGCQFPVSAGLRVRAVEN
jgi:predicted molibdopterin-dependent oxidoreductase YjgC